MNHIHPNSLLANGGELRTFGTYEYIRVGLDYYAVCNRCGGSGLYGAPTPHTDSQSQPFCFSCGGSGKNARVKPLTVEEAIKRAERLDRAAAKARAKEAEAAAAFLAAKFLTDWDEAIVEDQRWEARREANAATHWLPEKEGAKVTIKGTLAFLKMVGEDSQYGPTLLIRVKIDEQYEVSMFTGAKWAWELWSQTAELGFRNMDPITLSVVGTVKSHDDWKGRKTTQLTRVKGEVL